MKGLELPVNIIVIMIVAVLVLLAFAFYFTSQSSQGASAIVVEKAHQEGCIRLRAAPVLCEHTKVNDVPVSYNDKTYSLGNVCALRGITDSVQCAKSCGCVAEGQGIALSNPASTQTGGTGLALVPEDVSIDFDGNVV